MEEEFNGRSSLDNQIREAKTRAELFSKSLQDARAQEAIALKILEQERERWAHSFEEKSIMIEQLERELTSTVEALDVERSTDRLPRAAELKELSSDEVDQSFHDLMNDVNAHIPLLNRSFENNTMRRTADFGNHTNNNGASMRPTSNLGSTYTQTQQYPTAALTSIAGKPVSNVSTDHPPRRAVSPPKEVSKPDETAVWRDLLEQYQQQLKLSKSECIAAAEEKEAFRTQLVKLEQQVVKLIEEKELYAAACEHAEGKLKFRVAQIIECEESKEILNKRVTELGTLNGDLQNQLTSLRHELAVANAELRIHSTRSENQALREQTQASATAPATATQEPMTGSSPADVFAKPGFSRSDNYHAPQPAKSSPEVSVQLQQQQQQQYQNSTREPVYSTSAFLHSSRDDELELSFPARQRIQATEAYAKDLHRQLDEAHARYSAQLEEARRTANSLQMLLKDAERRGDDLRTRCQAAEQAASQYQAERNALLTMVSKLHLSETAATTSSTPSTSSVVADSSLAQREDVTPSMRPPANLNSRQYVNEQGPLPPAPSSTVQIPQFDRSPSPIHPPPQQQHPEPSLERQLSRSRDFTQKDLHQQAHFMSAPSHLVQHSSALPVVEFDDSFTDASGDHSSSDEGAEEEEEDEHGRYDDMCEKKQTRNSTSATTSVAAAAAAAATATQSVLYAPDQIPHGTSQEAADFTPVRDSHAPILKMLSSSGEGPKGRKQSTKRRLRSSSGEGKAITQRASKGTTVGYIPKTNVRDKAPAPTAGQPGKSMVIRKPPTYTGAFNDKFVRGGHSQAVSIPTPTVAVSKTTKTSSAKRKIPSSATAKDSKNGSRARSNQKAIKVHIPASYSNNPDHDHDHGNDISWGSGDSAPHPLCGDALGGEVSFPTDAELQGGLEDGLDSVGLTIAQPEATPTAAPAPVHIPQFANKQQLTLPAPSAHGIAVKAPFLSHSGARDEEQYPTSAVTQMQDQVEKEKDPLNRTMEIVELPDSHVAGGISYYEVGRGRANSINSLTSINSVGSAVSSRTGRSTAEAAHANHHHHHRQQHHRTTPGTYSGVTEIKISRKSAPGEQINSTSHTGGSPQVTAAARESSGKKISISSGGKKSRPAAARTPSPMLRNAPSAPSSGHVGDSLSGRTVTVPSGPRIAKIYTPASYSASFSTSAAAGVAASAPAVVTPATGSSSKASRLLSAYSQKSAPKKSPSGSKIKSSNLRSNSLMY